MKIEMRDEKTLVITPESIAEQVLLKRFEGAQAKTEKPQPFHTNVEPLIIEVKP